MDLYTEQTIGLMDHRFLGILLPFPTGDRIGKTISQALRLMRNGKWDDVREVVKKHLRKYKEESAELLLKISAPWHERKHFHDMMLSPFGAHLLGRYWQVYFNWRELVTLLADEPKIGIPFDKWVKASSTLLETYGLSAPPDEFTQMIGQLETFHNSIELISSRAPDAVFWFQPLESAAMNVQETWLASSFGEEAPTIIRQAFRASPAGEARYYGAKSDLLELTKNPQLSPLVANAIYFMSLCGDTTEKEQASPSWRFAKFLQFAKENGKVLTEENIEETYSDFLKRSGLMSIEDSLVKSQNYLADAYQFAEKHVTEHRTYTTLEEAREMAEGLRKEYADLLPNQAIEWLIETIAKLNSEEGMLQYFHNYIAIRQTFIKQYLSDKRTYHSPVKYIESIDKFPSPPLFFIAIEPVPWRSSMNDSLVPVEGVKRDGKFFLKVAQARDLKEILPITCAMEMRACFESKQELLYSFLRSWISSSFEQSGKEIVFLEAT